MSFRGNRRTNGSELPSAYDSSDEYCDEGQDDSLLGTPIPVSEPSDNNSSKNGGLHHRRRHNSADSNDSNTASWLANSNHRAQEYSDRKKQQRRLMRNRTTKKSGIPVASYLQSCLLAGIPAYLLFLFFTLHNATHNHRYDQDGLSPFLYHHEFNTYDAEVPLSPEFYQNVEQVQEHSQNQRQQRSLTDQKEWDTVQTIQQQLQQTASNRRTRSRPTQESVNDLLSSGSILSLKEHPRPPPVVASETTTSSKSSSHHHHHHHASLEELCGFHAQTAHLQTPATFRSRDALVKESSRKLRILITGIVSTPLGYRLATALRQKCGVQVVIAMDHLYPNSLENRLKLQERMAVLTKFIPKMVRPIFVGHIGLDPIRHAKNFQKLPATNDLDIVQTFQPTHIVHLAHHSSASTTTITKNKNKNSNNNHDWKNRQSPYVRATENANGYYHDPPFYAIKMGMVSMEQILASIANAPVNNRPHFIYASSSSIAKTSTTAKTTTANTTKRDNVHEMTRQMDEVMADFYHQHHGVFSIGIRMPQVYGPWDYESSPIHRILHSYAKNALSSHSTTSNTTIIPPDLDLEQDMDLMYVDDVVDAIIAAMQYRPNSDEQKQSTNSLLLELPPEQTYTLKEIDETVKQLITQSGITSIPQPHPRHNIADETYYRQTMDSLKRRLAWSPHVSLGEGLALTLAWHLDRIQPYGPAPPNTPAGSASSTTISGDGLLKQLSLPHCDANDIGCHGGRPILPCASECAMHKPDTCVKTIFDDMVPLVQDLTEECDIVLYTQYLDNDAEDLDLHAEFMDEGDPLVCNFAFVSRESPLTKSVIAKVPDHELKNLDFEITPEDAAHPGGIRERKLEKLNGRLLYRGWILVWTKDTPKNLLPQEEYLLKLSPGRFFHKDVKSAVYIDQQFGVSPKADDIIFLVHEMYRKAWEPRLVKRKSRPKAKFLLPAEPERKAVILLAELKYQDSPESERLPSTEKISSYEATRFMRYEVGESTPLGKEPSDIKVQREFYSQLRAYINPDIARSPKEPVHKFEVKHWARTRWVAHDLTQDESRTQIRCPWYQEHVLWGTPVDQLSFAYIIEKLDLERKLSHHEPDESIQKHLSEKTEMKQLLSDTFEWISLQTEDNKLYCSYEEMQILPYAMDHVDEHLKNLPSARDRPKLIKSEKPLLYARIISDRIMAYARKAWNKDRKKREKQRKHAARTEEKHS